jgi:FlaA1/EpsC-like NDP-sugar epimerase
MSETFDLNSLASQITSRQESFFESDVKLHFEAISSAIKGKKIALFGAAGFIATQTLKSALAFSPREIVLIDVNENSLTDLIRTLRNDFQSNSLPVITPVLADVTSPRSLEIHRAHSDIELIWNFAAVKHVRSERDPISLFRMFDVNILGMKAIRDIADKSEKLESLFSVSTDKAANPVSFMGASKRIMEQVLFSGTEVSTTSARFANVAFSSGSLLESWLKRIPAMQPVPVPKETRRYFVSPIESGQLCLLAATVGTSGKVTVPNLDPKDDLVDLAESLERILVSLKLTPVYFEDEEQAKHEAPRLSSQGKQAVLLTSRDTSGEKPFEEFVGKGEVLSSLCNSLSEVASPTPLAEKVTEMLSSLNDLKFQNIDTSLNTFEKIVEILVPQFKHEASTKSLDNRL